MLYDGKKTFRKIVGRLRAFSTGEPGFPILLKYRRLPSGNWLAPDSGRSVSLHSTSQPQSLTTFARFAELLLLSFRSAN